jgi:hypothetical protein
MPLPSREEQLRQAIAYFRRDGVVLIKNRKGHVADDLCAWAAAQGIAVERRLVTAGRAEHWEIRRVPNQRNGLRTVTPP